MAVYEILFPPDETQYKGMVHLAVLNKNKEMKSLGSCVFEDLPKRIEKMEFLKSRNYYITANTTVQYTQRRNYNLFSLSNIVLDFDFHKRENQHIRTETLESFIWYVKRDLFYISKQFSIPCCNCIVRTGRGIQLWWHIFSCSGKLLFLYRAVIDLFAVIFKAFLEEYPSMSAIELDVSSSKNPVGLFRLPEPATYNTHTGTMIETEILHSNGIDLNELYKRLQEHYIVLEHQEQIEKRIDNFKKKSIASKKGVKTRRKNNSFESLHRKRLAFIKWWSEQMEDNVGKRDLMIYLGYNASIQVMVQAEARKWCNKLNKSFSEPLETIDYIFNQIRKPFNIRNTRFFEMLGATEQDITRFEKEYSKLSVNLTRNIEIEKRKQTREQKKEQARRMLKNGETIHHTANTVGLSVSTIARISAEIGSKNKLEKPWEVLGISRATYYRKLKERENMNL